MKTAALILACLALLGCASAGRLCLVDLDARTPAQVAAQRVEALAPYHPSSGTSNAVQSRTAIPWDIVPDILKLGFRVRVGSYEWGARPESREQ